eukprot:scpid109027/ scgid13913/ 
MSLDAGVADDAIFSGISDIDDLLLKQAMTATHQSSIHAFFSPSSGATHIRRSLQPPTTTEVKAKAGKHQTQAVKSAATIKTFFAPARPREKEVVFTDVSESESDSLSCWSDSNMSSSDIEVVTCSSEENDDDIISQRPRSACGGVV